MSTQAILNIADIQQTDQAYLAALAGAGTRRFRPVPPTKPRLSITVEASDQGDYSKELQHMGDPDFMRLWAELRRCLFFIAKEEPRYLQVKQQYDTAAVEYRRRMGGGLAAASLHH